MLFIWIWHSRCHNKLRVFIWLLLMDKLNTKNISKKRKQKLEGTTIIVSYVKDIMKKQPFICSTAAPLANSIGNKLASSGVSPRVSTKC